MASEHSATIYGFSPPSELRILLLGKAGAGKSKVTKAILGCKDLRGDVSLCVRREGEMAGKKVVLVDTPGWDRVSVKHTSTHVKQEIARSAIVCSPGPHVVLLVLPVSDTLDIPSGQEMKVAKQNVEILSERVWKYTMVLFVCEGELERVTIDQHIERAQKLLQRCDGRHYVLQTRSWETPIMVSEFLKKMEDFVEENLHEFFIPQVYHDLIQRSIPQSIAQVEQTYDERREKITRLYKNKLEAVQTELNTLKEKSEKDGKEGVRKRRSSFDFTPPHMAGGERPKPEEMERAFGRSYFVSHYLKPGAVVLMALVGALIGSVIHGGLGSFVGIIVGGVVFTLLTMLVITAVGLTRDNSQVLVPEVTAIKLEDRQASTVS